MENNSCGFKILENHPADVRVYVRGKTKQKLFLNALLAMNKILDPQIRTRVKSISRKIKIKSIDLNALIVDFLNEVLYQVQTNKEIYFQVQFKKFKDTEINAELIGRPFESLKEDIKAATYHNLEIKRKKGFFETMILFDV